ncbi:MAG: DUF3575 domain-containing protein [Ginsengibacter sp.]
MKKVIFSAAIFLFSTAAFAQSDVQPNVVKINPLGALIGAASLGYERALNEKSSVVILPSFGFLKSGGFKYTTIGLGAEYRIYFTGSAPRGTYVAPGAAAEFGTAKVEDNSGGQDSKTNISGFSVKAIIGHQWIWNSSFVLDLNGGIQYINLNFKDKSGDFAGANALSGILPALSFSIGYNF